THPPGLFCFFHGLIALVDRTPAWKAWLLTSQPDGVRESLATIAANSAKTRFPTTPRDAAVIWLAILIDLGLAAATVAPLYALFRFRFDRATAFAAAALWPAVPAVAIFVPKSDAAYPCLAAVAVWLFVSTWRKPTLLRGLLTGLFCWLGMF